MFSIKQKFMKIKDRIKQTNERIKKKVIKQIDENSEEIRGTKWIAEIVKIAVTSFFTILLLYCIRVSTPGNFTDNKLKEYLDSLIINQTESEFIDSTIVYNDEYDVLSDKDVIIVFSKCYDESVNIQESVYPEYTSCFSVFSRKKNTLWNELFGTQPGYRIELCCSTLSPIDFSEVESFEFDNDGKKEFIVSTTFRTASKIYKQCFLIVNDNGEWKILSPDIYEILDSIASVTGCPVDVLDMDNPDMISSSIDSSSLLETELFSNVDLHCSIIHLYDLLNEEKVYNIMNLYASDYLAILKNPLNNSTIFCYQISADCYQDDYYEEYETKYIYIAEQINRKTLFIDPNWNMGAPLILNNELSFEDDFDSYWGIQTEGHIFYADPDYPSSD